MKSMNRKTFILNELKHLSSMNTTNLRKLAALKNRRVNEALFVYLCHFSHKNYDSNLFAIQVEVLKYKNNMKSEYEGIYEKYESFWESHLKMQSLKEEIRNSVKDLKNLNKVCKKMKVNYGNAHKFFKGGELKSLKLLTASKIATQLKELDEMKIKQ